MPQENYRYYCLDSTGRLSGADWFCADSDEHAIEIIQEKHPNDRCEIWKGKRLIATLGPDRRSA